MFCPRGCALMYVCRELQESVRPIVASHRFFEDFQSRFLAQQVRDNTPYCCVPAALEFIANLGGQVRLVLLVINMQVWKCLSVLKRRGVLLLSHTQEVINTYNARLVDWAADMLSQRWNQPKLPIPVDMLVPFMRAVRLPEPLQGPQTLEHAKSLVQKFSYQGVHCAVDLIGGELWTRVSAQVYNFPEEYERFAQVVELMAIRKSS